jgi:transcriptional regulator with XRE-family HTH domain
MSMTAGQAKQLGALIARTRIRKQLSLRALASRSGMTASWIAHVQAGRFLDPAPDRLARLAEALDIEPSKIDRITKGSMAGSLPELGTYFRAKYDLSPAEIAQVERYVRRLRSKP